jgi:hypothetical protein
VAVDSKTELEKAAAQERPSLAKTIVETRAESGLSFDQAAYLCGSMYGAGSHTVRCYSRPIAQIR